VYTHNEANDVEDTEEQKDDTAGPVFAREHIERRGKTEYDI
jgi:hypothetical protein